MVTLQQFKTKIIELFTDDYYTKNEINTKESTITGILSQKADKTNATQSNAGLMSAEDKTKLDTIDTQYSINVEKQSTADTGFFSTYVIKQNNTQKGVKINIPKDFLVKSTTVKTCTTANSPVSGYEVGDKYIDFVINSKDSTDTDEHLYLATKEIGAYPVDEVTLTVANGKLVVKNNGITWAKLATDVQNTINGKEVTSNKVNSVSASSTITQYPSAKCVYDTFCQKNDPRLSDARTPTSHTHKKAEISDFPTSMTPTSHTHGNVTNDGKVGTAANKPLITGTNGVVQVGSFGTTANTFCQGNDSRLSDARTPKSHTHTKAEISDFPTSMTPTSHTHGNITNAGAIGTAANKPLITGTNGIIQASSFGIAANTFCQGNDSRLSNARTPIFNHIDASSSVAKDLNNYKTGGFYYTQSNSDDVPYVANRPGNRNFAFFLLVETWGVSNDKYVKQTLTYYDNNVTYIRTCNNGAWNAWTALIREGDSRLTNARTPISHTDSNGAYGKATTSVWGHTKLNSATNSTDETTAATPKAVKAAYDLANGKITNGTGTVTSTNIADKTIVNGDIADNAAISYSKLSGVVSSTDSRLTNARTPTAHASTATTYGASSASNYGHSMASSTSPKAPGTANVGSETAKFARGDHVHPLQSSTTTTLSLVNTIAMSGTVKCTESNGWGVVYFEGLKCTNITTEYTPFATLPHTSKVRIYANFNLDATGTNAILLRVDNNQLQGKVMTANQRMYGSIVYPIA